MGLFQDRYTGVRNHLRHFSVPLVMALISSIIAVIGDSGREALRYDRNAILDGEFWRLISGHFAHLGWQHLLLNLAGLVLVWLLIGRQYTTRQWVFVTVISLAVINSGFWVLDPNLTWYVGLSGLLHGLLIAGAFSAFRSVPIESGVIVLAVACKLAFEQISGPLPGSEETAGGSVVINAHLYGAIGGAISGIVLWRSVRSSPSI